jgi:hypothetical protein
MQIVDNINRIANTTLKKGSSRARLRSYKTNLAICTEVCSVRRVIVREGNPIYCTYSVSR